MSWAGFVGALKRTPGWVWGVLSGAAGAALLALRLRDAADDQHAAEAREKAAEARAEEATVKAEAAKLDAEVTRATETSRALEEARGDVREATEAELAEVEAMDDAKLAAFFTADQKRREREDGGG